MQPVFFWALAAVIMLGSGLVVRLPNIFHAGLALVTTFGAVAGIYAMLDAHFLAAVQVLIYIGAISVILLFGVMLTQHIAARETGVSRLRHVGAFLACALFAAFGTTVVNSQKWPVLADPSKFKYVSVQDIGFAFLDKSRFLLPFELVAVLLLVALVGAVLVAFKEGT